MKPPGQVFAHAQVALFLKREQPQDFDFPMTSSAGIFDFYRDWTIAVN